MPSSDRAVRDSYDTGYADGEEGLESVADEFRSKDLSEAYRRGYIMGRRNFRKATADALQYQLDRGEK